MTWLRQAAHVAAKDARMAWYLFAALVPLVALQAFGVGGSLMSLWSILVPLVTLVLVAYVVQADPAVRSDAFWVTLPLARGAVFTAKVLTAAAVLTLVLVGEGIVLARHQATTAQVTDGLLGNAGGEAWLLAIAILIAALTRDLRTFLLALILGFVAAALVAMGVATRVLSLNPASLPPWLWPIVLIVGSLAIAGYQYGTGRRLRSAVTAIVFLGAVLLLSAAFRPNVFGGPISGPPLPQRLRPDSVVAARLARAPGRPPDEAVSLHLAGGSRQLEYTLTAATLQVRQRDGSLKTVPLFPATPVSGAGIVPEVPGAHWVNLGGISARITWAHLAGYGQNRLVGTPLRLDGEIQAAQPFVGTRLPLRAGVTQAKAGRRIRIVGATLEDGDVSIDLEISRLEEADEPLLDTQPIAYALLDRARATVYPLTRSSSSGGSTGFLGGGARVTTEHLELAPDYGPARSSPAGPGPFELLVLDWRVVGSYHVSLPVETRTQEEPGPANAPAPAGPLDLRASSAVGVPTPAH